MDDQTMLADLQQGIVYLEKTTVGYVGHPSSWYRATTTMWFKALVLLDAIVTELQNRTAFSLAQAGTPQSGQKLTLTIKVGS